MIDFTEQIRENRRALIYDIFRRIEAWLEPFADDLQEFLSTLLKSRLPADWRERWHAFVDESAAKGFVVQPQSVVELEAWIEAWAKRRKLLPQPQLANSVEGEQADHDSRFMLAAFKAPPARNPPAAPPAPPEAPPRATFNQQGIEIAGPGPQTAASFRAKVQSALTTLDPKVGNWWRANSVSGQVRARDASFLQWGYYSQLEGDQPVIVVDQGFTAGRTAQAIISEVTGGWFADSIGAFYKKYRFAKTHDFEEFQAWQRGATAEAAALASVFAELYFSSIASLNSAGDLVIALGDVAERGPQWDQLLSVLPSIGNLPFAIILKVGQRETRISKDLAKKFHLLTEAERDSILRSVKKAKSDEEAKSIIKRLTAQVVGNRQIHHPISAVVYKALEEHKKLRGKYQYRDKRFETLAKTLEDHLGYEDWHIKVDEQVADWIRGNREATENEFEAFLRWRYSQPDLRKRFPSGLK